ncbi:MAG: transporter substrate-binding domain-containing protein [Granulosicoccaceae bacterium]
MRSLVVMQLAPSGMLKAGINMSNFLLVTDKAADGQPIGVSPDIAHELAAMLGVESQLISYPGPGELADAIATGAWDIGNIAAEAERAKTIQFSIPYCEIQATYLLPAGTAINAITEVDSPGNRIVVKQRSAYDLWLSENLKHATIVRTDSVDSAFDLFVNERLEVLAGLRPKLIEQQTQLKHSRLFDESFTAIQQSIGCARGMPEAAQFLNEQIEQWIADGFIQSLIDKHGVSGKLSVASQPD